MTIRRSAALQGDAAAAVVPRPASTTLVVRDGEPGLEVLMVRRSPQASFMPGAYVFPGGAVDDADASADAAAVCDETPDAVAARIGAVTGVGERALAYAVAALRECAEECGLWLGDTVPRGGAWALAALRQRLHAGEAVAELARRAGLPLATSVLRPWGRWVTPLGLPKRFDTLFFLAPAPAGQHPSVDAGETTTLAWVHPPSALAEHARGGFPMEFATVQTIASLQPFGSQPVQALLAHAAALASVPPMLPRLRLDAGGRIEGVALPGDAGYEALAG